MTRQQVIELMESSQSSEEWNANCDKVKKTCNGYPSFWFKEIILSGLAAKVTARWGGNDKIIIS